MPSPSERDCEHGQLRRSCNICEYEKEIKDLAEKLRLADMFINKIDDRKYKQMRATYKALIKAIELVADDQFGLLLMWNEKHKQDMWYVERLTECNGRQDYYGPFFHKWNAEKFKNNEL